MVDKNYEDELLDIIRRQGLIINQLDDTIKELIEKIVLLKQKNQKER